MRAGSLRNYITIQQKTVANDDANLELVESWSTFTQCWASIEPLMGREFWSARQTVSEVTGKIRIRYVAGITTEMRIVDGSKIYDIEAVIDFENRHEELILLVKENP